MSTAPKLSSLLLCGALLCSAPALADEGVTLEQALSQTLLHSPVLQQGEAKVKQVAGQMKQAAAAFDWTIAGKAGWERLYMPRIRNGVLTDELETSSALKAEAGISKTFPNGITVQPGFVFYANTSASEAQTFGLTKPRPHINVNIPLWQGSGQNNLARTTQKAAEQNLEASRSENQFLRARALHDVAQVYWRCLALKGQFDAARQSEEESLDYDALLKRQAETGQLEPVELDRAMAQQAVRHVDVSKLRLTLQACLRELAQSMGGSETGANLPARLDGRFPDLALMGAAVQALDQARLTELALERRLDLQALSQQVGAADTKLRGARNGLGPKVDLSLDTDGVFLNLSKSLEGNLENGLLEEAQGAQSQARLALKLAQDQARRDIGDQVQALKAGLQDWRALSRSVHLLEGVMDSTRKRVQAGVLTRQSQIDTANNLAETRQAMIDAQWRFVSALAALRLVTGTLSVPADAQAEAMAGLFRVVPGAADEHG